VKRRATVIAAATGLLVLVGSSVAQADAAIPSARDSSGCVVLLPDAAQPLTVCLFPR